MTAEEDVRTWGDCHTEAVTAICLFSVPPSDADNYGDDSERELALSASEDGTLKVWDLAQGSCIATMRGTDEKGKLVKGNMVQACCVYKTSEGEWEALSGGKDNHVRRWAVSPAAERFGKEIKHSGQIRKGDRTLLQDDTGPSWMAKHDTMKGRKGHKGVVSCCCVSEDGKRALTCSGDRTAIFWDLTTGTEMRTLHHVSGVHSCCFLPGEKVALTASSFAPRLWDVYSGECLRIFAGHSGEVLHCVSLPRCFGSASCLLRP